MIYLVTTMIREPNGPKEETEENRKKGKRGE